MEEKVSSELKLADLRIDGFRRSLDQFHDFASSFNLQWKELEDHYASIHNDVQKRMEELHSIEDSVQKKLEDVDKREEELNVVRDSIEERLREVEAREKEFDLIQEKEIQGMKSEFELIERSRIELEAVSESIKTKSRFLEEKEDRLRLLNDSVDEKTRQVREFEREVSQARKEIEIKEEQCAQLRNELKVKEEQIEERSKMVALKDDKFIQWAAELKLKGKELEEKRKEWTLEAKKIKSKENQIQDMCKEVELEKKRLVERCRVVELKEKQIQGRCDEVELDKKKLMERCREVELKEKRIQGRSEEVELENKTLMKRRGEVELKEKKIQGRYKEVDLEKKKLTERDKEVELKEKLIQERYEEVETEKKKKIMERDKEVELNEKRIQERYEEMVLERKKLNERCDKIYLEEKLIKGKREEVELEMKNLMELRREVDLQKRQIQERCQEVEMEKKKLIERCEEVGLKQKQLDERCSEFESNEKKLFDSNRKPFGVNYAKVHQEDANLHFVVSMDGKALQVFLNEHCAEYDSMRNDVFVALGLSSDPAKLVLDAIQGFYPPHLKNGDKEFETEVIRKSCILLLEQLMKISPDIRPPVKNEAMRLAIDWITKMKTDAEHSLEVLGFLLLLASYGLAYAFDTNKLFKHLEIVALHSQAPELFRALGFADKVSGFIRNLAVKKQQIEAIRFIHAFELMSEFPPVLLLDGFLNDSKTATKKLRKANVSLEGQIKATNKRMVDLRHALKCIEECNIKYKIPAKTLKLMIESLEKDNFKRKAEAYLLGLEMRKPSLNKKKRLYSTFANVDYPVLAPVTSSATSHSLTLATDDQQRQLSGNKRPRRTELAEKSSNTCRGDADRGDLPLKSKDASAPLDPQPKSTCFPVNTNKGISAPLDLQPKSNCSSVDTNKDASASLDLQPNTYCSSVKTNKDASAPLDLQPKSSCLSVDTNKGASAPLDLQPKYSVNTNKDASPPLDLQPKCNCFSVNTNKEIGKIAGELQFTCDPGKLVFDITNISFPFKLEENGTFKLHIPKKCCNFLLEQLRNDLFQINPEIKEQAKEFALHWQTILEKKRDDPLEVNCFLQFLSAYKLASCFDAEKLLGLLLSLLDTDYWCKAAPELCRDLGLTEKIPSFIQNHIKRGQHIEAVKYIYALTIVDSFPPLLILKDYLINSSIATQHGDMDSEINALKDVLKCISDFKITGISPEILQKRIVLLELRKEKLGNPEGAVKPSHYSMIQPPLPMYTRPGSFDSQPDPYVNGPPSYDSSMRNPQAPPRVDGSGQPPPLLQHPVPFMSQSNPYMNATPGPYSSTQTPHHYYLGWFMNQGVPSAAIPQAQQLLLWNGYCYVPAR